MNIISKIHYWWKKPKLILIMSDDNSALVESILISFLEKEKNVIIINGEKEKLKRKHIFFLIKNSSLPVIISDNTENKILKYLPRAYFVCISRNNGIKKYPGFKNFNVATVGFDECADFMATDINRNGETNFKLIHEGDTVPFWIDKKVNDTELTVYLLAIASSKIIGENFVWISQKLKAANTG